MKILFLSSEDQSFSTKLLIKEFKLKGNQSRVVDPKNLAFQLSPNQVVSKDLTPIQADLIIPRFGILTFSYGIQVLKAFEALGIKTINSAKAIELSSNKLNCLSFLAKLHYPIPKTWFFHSTQDFYSKIDFPFPLVCKILDGSQGKGVSLIKDRFQLFAWVDLLRTKEVPFLLQEFIKGKEFRVLIFRKKILASLLRAPKKGEFRANHHLGGKGTKVELKSHEASLAIEVVAGLGLDFAGVDFIRTPKGPILLEVNSFPGIEGISKITKLPIAKEIVKEINLTLS